MRPSLTAVMMPLASPVSRRASLRNRSSEMRVRVTPSLWSYGAGLQYSSHDVTGSDLTIGLGGVFFEPRRVFDIGNARYAPYLSSRLAYLSCSAEIEDFGTRAVGGANPELSLAVARRATATISQIAPCRRSCTARCGRSSEGRVVVTAPTVRVRLQCGSNSERQRLGRAQPAPDSDRRRA